MKHCLSFLPVACQEVQAEDHKEYSTKSPLYGPLPSHQDGYGRMPTFIDFQCLETHHQVGEHGFKSNSDSSAENFVRVENKCE